MIVELMTSKEHFAEMERTAAESTLTCHANVGKMSAEDYKPSDTLKNIIKWGHESTLEHIKLSYRVKDLSRACLQELARHRHISLSVESTRHTLKQKIKNGDIKNYLPPTSTVELNQLNYFNSLAEFLRMNPDTPNDCLKYVIPECVCTNLVMSANIRELRHIIKVRSAPAALAEFQELTRKLYEVVPDEFKYLLEDCLYSGELTNDKK